MLTIQDINKITDPIERRKLKIHGPNFFPLYDTKEVIAVTGKQLKIDEDDL